ncbi:ABC transporter ATP-binding protein [Lachnospiraceae bacterium OM02-31]|nr:ABC transporter ATP-binding protein [Lachnospiraceae bacterium OM02-31]RJW59453.1 ABC transporter ATP-binding protein [Lachnospiraceae bacterium OM02-3]
MIRKLNYIFNKRDKVRIIILLFMIIIGSFLELTGVAAFMPFIEIVMSPSNIQENIWLSKIYTTLNLTSTDMFLAIMALGISAIYIVKNIYLIIMQNCILKFSYRTRKNIAVRLLKTYMEEPYTFHLNKNVAELQRSLQIDTNQFMLLVNNSLQMMAEITVCIVLGLYLFNTSHSITGIVLALLVICVGFFFYVSKKVTLRLGLQNQRYNAKLIQWVDQSLGGIKEVKILKREDFFVSSYEKNYEKLIWGARINELLSAMPRHIVEAVCITGLLGAIVVKMFWGYAGNEVSDFIPQLAVCAVGAFRLLPAVGKMNAYANSIMYCKPSLDLVYNDLQQIRNHKECGVYRHQDDTKWTFKEGIKLINITYKYPDAEQAVLTKINLEIPKGSTVAFIGTSGAGKTTLADIILGLLPPEEGKVLVDNKDIYSNLQCWYNHLGYIPQTIYLSDDTIRNNIAFGIKEEEIIDESVWTALKKAQLVDFVDKLDNGLDTFVGERGMRLSGGQRQRIGIARALYHNPDILILDEATSALDNDTEQAVMDSIESLKREKTILIIAHRLTTIRNADIIYEIADGLAVRKSKDEIFGE